MTLQDFDRLRQQHTDAAARPTIADLASSRIDTPGRLGAAVVAVVCILAGIAILAAAVLVHFTN